MGTVHAVIYAVWTIHDPGEAAIPMICDLSSFGLRAPSAILPFPATTTSSKIKKTKSSVSFVSSSLTLTTGISSLSLSDKPTVDVAGGGKFRAI